MGEDIQSTIREEIKSIISNGYLLPNEEQLLEKNIDQILKLFEKRIDNQINQLEEFKEISSKSKIKEYEIAQKYFRGLKELLK